MLLGEEAGTKIQSFDTQKSTNTNPTEGRKIFILDDRLGLLHILRACSPDFHIKKDNGTWKDGTEGKVHPSPALQIVP